jgi:hypothetical protein
LKQITETGFKKPRTLIELKEIRSNWRFYVTIQCYYYQNDQVPNHSS